MPEVESGHHMDQRALEAQRDEAAMNQFVADSRNFILQCASRTCRRFITDSDDEYEVALTAFWEAVRQYNGQAGSFSAFAALIIRRRLMDFFDTRTRRSREIPVGHSMTWDEEQEQTEGMMAEIQKAIVREHEEDPRDVKDEIEDLGEVLKEYGFSFFDLAAASPRAGKTKQCCARAVNWMLAVAERILQMRKTHALPVAAISAALTIARKILERHRRYIIAATEILDGDYPHLAEYMDYIRKERTA